MSKNDCFSVKQAHSKKYSPIMQINLLTKFGWQEWWKLKIPPKLKFLGWRVFHNILPNFVLEKYFGYFKSPMCLLHKRWWISLSCLLCLLFCKECLVWFIRNEDSVKNVILCQRQDVVVRRGSRGVADQSTTLLPIK